MARKAAVAVMSLRHRPAKARGEQHHAAHGEQREAVIDDIERGVPACKNAERKQARPDKQAKGDDRSQEFRHSIRGLLTQSAGGIGRGLEVSLYEGDRPSREMLFASDHLVP
jgi:hypothetical protein